MAGITLNTSEKLTALKTLESHWLTNYETFDMNDEREVQAVHRLEKLLDKLGSIIHEDYPATL